MAPTSIVQTVTATTMAELLARRDAAVDGDLIELRVDGVTDLDVRAAVTGSRCPVIVTCRPAWEGGRWQGEESQRRRWFAQAVEAGAAFVDIEWRAGWLPDTSKTHTRVVVSNHDFHGVPSDLDHRVAAMRGTGADVVKVAVTVERVTDVIRLRQVAGPGPRGADTVVIGMGEAGQLTRLLPTAFGSCWTYGGEVAPGQLPARDLRQQYRIGARTPSTRLYGVAGAPIGHSASPAMHNALFHAEAIDAVYLPVLAATPGDALMVCDAFGFDGASLTAPLKTAVLSQPSVHADDETVPRLAAANTLKRSERGWLARNFDVAGFLQAFDSRTAGVQLRTGLVVGAGGAARAAVFGLRQRGIAVAVTARRADAAAAVAADLGGEVERWPPSGAWDVVVNATPVGTWPRVDASPLAGGLVSARVAYDLIYNPEATAWLSAAAQAGSVTIGGLDMLVEQAACQFEWWIGRPADRRVMREAARVFVRERSER